MMPATTRLDGGDCRKSDTCEASGVQQELSIRDFHSIDSYNTDMPMELGQSRYPLQISVINRTSVRPQGKPIIYLATRCIFSNIGMLVQELPSGTESVHFMHFP